jgi:hypothetical protein
VLLWAAAFWVGPQVDGLEYEDAYIHKAAAIWRSFNWDSARNGFYSTVCFAGSVADCLIDGSFGTQLIGFSILIAMGRVLVGDSQIIANVLSAVASLLTIQVVWSMLVRNVSTAFGRLFGVALIATSASFHLIASSGFAEPLFTLFLVVTFYCCQRIREDDAPAPAFWLLLATSGALMILAKKEGALLLIILVMLEVIGTFRAGRSNRSFGLIAILIGLLVGAVTVVGILEAADRHSADIGEAAFRLPNVTRLFPVLAEAAANPKYFGLLGVAFAVVLPFAIYVRDPLSTRIACIVVAYVTIYSAHARHWHFVDGAAVYPSEFLRYLYVVTPLAAVLVAVTVNRLYIEVARRSFFSHSAALRLTGALVAFGLLGAGYSLHEQRSDMSRDETQNRTGILRNHPGGGTKAIFVSSYSTALVALGGQDTTIVDSAMLEYQVVFEWLSTQASDGVSIVIDEALCGRPDLHQWTANCGGQIVR